jgi:hypothetical protein
MTHLAKSINRLKQVRVMSIGLLVPLLLIVTQTADVFGQLTPSGCITTFHEADSLYHAGVYIPARNRGSLFLLQCAISDSSWRMFGILDSVYTKLTAQHLAKWWDYQFLLNRVVVLDSTERSNNYYCSDVRSSILTYQDVDTVHPPHGYLDFVNLNTAVSLIDYVLSTTQCPRDSAYLLGWRSFYRKLQPGIWRRTASGTVIDTVDRPLDSIGLSNYKRTLAYVAPARGMLPRSVTSFRATQSPFRSSTVLLFELSEAEVLQVDLVDVLGHEVANVVPSGFFSAGKHSAGVFGEGFPTGSIYARLTAANGEVRTLKLVKLR